MNIAYFEMIGILLVAVILSACGKVQGYSGAVLPDDKTATIRIMDKRIQVDDVDMGYSSVISVLPGYHQASASWNELGDYYCTAIRGDRCVGSSNVRASYLCYVMFTINAGDYFRAELNNDVIEVLNPSNVRQDFKSNCSGGPVGPGHMVIVD